MCVCQDGASILLLVHMAQRAKEKGRHTHMGWVGGGAFLSCRAEAWTPVPEGPPVPAGLSISFSQTCEPPLHPPYVSPDSGPSGSEPFLC